MNNNQTNTQNNEKKYSNILNDPDTSVLVLGGVNEYGKNCYVVEQENKIFIFDMGMKYPKNEMYGITHEVPDIEYLINNKDKIVGLFLSHAHVENIGALSIFIKELKHVPIYGSKFTIEHIKDNYDVKNNLYIMHPNSVMYFGKLEMRCFELTHNIPGNLGYVLNNRKNAIVYTSDYVFEQNITKAYQSSIMNIAKAIRDSKVQILFSNSRIANRDGSTNIAREIKSFLENKTHNFTGKTFVVINSEDLMTLEELLQIAIERNQKVILKSERLESLLKTAIKTKVFQNYEKLFTKEEDVIDDNVLVITSGNKGYPFEEIEKLVAVKTKIKISEKDQILIALPILATFEKRYSELINQLYKVTENIEIIEQTKISEYTAKSEDIKLLLSIVQPKYIIPINGEYRNVAAQQKIMTEINRDPKDVIILLPEEQAEFTNGEFIKRFKKLSLKTIQLENSENPEIMENILRDRQKLSESGIFIVSYTLNNRNQVLDNYIEIVSRGYVETEKYNESMFQARKVVIEHTNEANQDPQYDWNSYRNNIRTLVGKALGKINGNKPMIATIISEQSPNYSRNKGS